MHPIPRQQVPVLMTNSSWRERAACRGIDYPEIFDAPAKKDDGLYLQALSMCKGCPVRSDCYDWAKADRAFEGVAAGRLWRTGKKRDVVAC